MGDRPASIPLKTGVESRNELRRIIKNQETYANLVVLPVEEAAANRPHRAVFACNYVIDEHFPAGAGAWRLLEGKAREFDQVINNACAHLKGLKDTVKVAGSVPMPKCHLDILHELLLQRLSPAPGSHQPRYRVVGIRKWVLTSATTADVEAYRKQLSRKSSPAAATDEPAKKRARVNDADGGQRRKKSAAANDNEDEAAPAAEEEEGRAVDDRLHAEAPFSPIASGLKVSMQESARLETRIRKEREKVAKQRQKPTRGNKKAEADDDYTAPLVQQPNVDIQGMMAFQYLGARSPDTFHIHTLKGYLMPHVRAVGPNTTPKEGQIIDPRAFLDFSPLGAENAYVSFLDRRHPSNPDAIFGKEAAMSYFTFSSTGKRVVCRRQTTLASYCDDDDRNEDEDEDEEEEEDEIVGDSQLDALLDEANVGLPPPPKPKPYQCKLAKDIGRKVPDPSKVTFPFPQLVYRVSAQLAAAESAPYAELVFPIGHVLSESEFQTGQPDIPGERMSELVDATYSLGIFEDRVNAERRARDPNAPEVGVIGYLVERAKQTKDLPDIESHLSEIPIELHRVPGAQREAEYEAQRNAVQMALAEERLRVKERTHDILFSTTHVPESTHKHVGVSDLVPLTELLRGSKQHRNRLRRNVEAILRQVFFANMDTLPPQERVAQERQLELTTEALVRQLAENEVDNISTHFVEKDDFLNLRIQMQTRLGVHRHSVSAMIKKVGDNADQLTRIENNYRLSTEALRIKGGEEVLLTLWSGENIPDALKSANFRAFLLKSCTPENLRALGADDPVLTSLDKPFVHFVQTKVDTMYMAYGVQEPGTRLYLATLTSALDSQTYKPNRLEPAGNGLVIGDTGAGKSHNSRAQISGLPPGIAQSTSTFSAQAFHTGTNHDNYLFVQEEGKAAILAPNKEDKERGGSDVINLFKELTTSFQAVSTRHVRDPETGQTHTLVEYSSAHCAFLWNSNFSASYLDKNIGRRFEVILQPILQGRTGFSAEQRQPLDVFKDEFGHRTDCQRDRITFAMYIVLKTFIKTAVLPELDTTYANMIIVAVLKELGCKDDSTTLHRFQQFAENLQLFYAAHMLCWSPHAAFYHRSKDAGPRFSSKSIVQQVPSLLIVGKEPVIMSLTTLDFLVVPTQVDSFLRDVIERLQLAKGMDKFRFRRFPGPDRNSDPVYDPNYLMIEGASRTAILNELAHVNRVHIIRAEDLGTFVEHLNQKLVSARPFETIERGEKGVPTRVAVADDEQLICSYTPILFEKNEAKAPGGPNERMCINLQYLQQYFGRDPFVPGAWKDIALKGITFDERTATREWVHEHLGFVRPADSKMAAAIAKVLNRSNLEQAAFEPEGGWPRECYEYMTGLTHRPIHAKLRVPTGVETWREIDHSMMINGTVLKQRLVRDPTRAPFMRINGQRPPETYASMLKARQNPDAFRLFQADQRESLGFYFPTVDGEFALGKFYLDQMGSPGCKPFLQLLGYSDADLEPFSDPQSTKPLPSSVPLGFGPLAYLVQKNIVEKCKFHVDKLLVPGDNIYREIRAAIQVKRYENTPPQLLTPEDRSGFLDMGDMALNTRFVGRIDFGTAGNTNAMMEQLARFANQTLEQPPPQEAEAEEDDGVDQLIDAMDIDEEQSSSSSFA